MHPFAAAYLFKTARFPQCTTPDADALHTCLLSNMPGEWGHVKVRGVRMLWFFMPKCTSRTIVHPQTDLDVARLRAQHADALGQRRHCTNL